MSVGIYTHYAHCDQAYFAVRLVELLRSVGEAFDIYSDNSPGKLKLPYDRIVQYKGTLKYTDWVKRRRVVVWTHVPRVEQIDYARRRGIYTILAPMWQELLSPFKKTMKRADRIVAFSKDAQTLYTDIYKFSNVSLIPFDTGLPITRKEDGPNPRNIRLFLPWFDRNAKCATSSFLRHISFLLEHMPEARLTVAVNSSRFGPAVARFFTRLGKRTGGRVVLARAVPYLKRPALFANADLTIWPAECDNYGFVGLTSLAAGTPVLTLGISPQTDYLWPDINAALVRTKIDYDENGVPRAVPDYSLLAAALQELIAEPHHIKAMQRKVSYNLAARRAAFEGGWRELLSL